jgi:hypothetical protein
LRPGFHFIGSRVETRRFQAMETKKKKKKEEVVEDKVKDTT